MIHVEHNTADSDEFDVAVVGGGQAGLALGYWLAKQGRRFVILEAGDSIGTAWRERWDSLVLFTSRRYDALPGLAFPGDPNGYPTRDEVIGYLERYAAEFNLPVQLDSNVRSISARDGRFDLDLGERQIRASQVVVATGPFQLPRTPALAEALASDVFQIHSSDYQRPSQIPGGVVLVVGGGDTGCQIAKELTATHDVHLAVGSRQTPLPQRVLGRDLFYWLDKLGVLAVSVDSRIGRRARDRGRDTLIGSHPRQARRHGVHLRPRAVAADGRRITFQDGSTVDPGALVTNADQRLRVAARISTLPKKAWIGGRCISSWRGLVSVISIAPVGRSRSSRRVSHLKEVAEVGRPGVSR